MLLSGADTIMLGGPRRLAGHMDGMAGEQTTFIAGKKAMHRSGIQIAAGCKSQELPHIWQGYHLQMGGAASGNCLCNAAHRIYGLKCNREALLRSRFIRLRLPISCDRCRENATQRTSAS